MIKRMDNTDKNFYKYMGRIFGSREVQRITYDRIYDDDKKEWIMNMKNNSVVAVVSIKDSIMKNILKEVYPEVSAGTVTRTYQNEYISAGYKIVDEKKNFLIISGGKEDGKN